MASKQTRPSSSRNTQLGIFAMPDSIEEGEDSDFSDGDFNLEAELGAISGDNYKPKKRQNHTSLPAADLNSMIAASLRDIPSDEDVSDGDDDPEILSELRELGIEDEESASPPPPPPRTSRPAPAPPIVGRGGGLVGLLEERIGNYTLAERNAKANGESSRARRFGRGLKTLNELLKQVKSGKTINEEDIPPVVSTGKQPASSAPSAPLPDAVDVPPTIVERLPQLPADESESAMEGPASPATPRFDPPRISSNLQPEMDEDRQKGLRVILQHREEFKAAALEAKHSGDKTRALELLRYVKQFDLVVEAYRNGETMDLNDLPSLQDVSHSAQKEQNTVEHSSDASAAEPAAAEDSKPASLITATSVEEALRQRLQVFKEQVEKAKEQGNSSKQRRMGRIVKQYEDAIKIHAAGKPIPVDELPTPPGYAPIPTGTPPTKSAAAAPIPSPRAPPRSAPAAPRPSPAAPRSAIAEAPTTRAAKQLAFLLQRQKEFKEAALKAKQDGDIGLAKEYLRNAKGFDAVIEAARGGLVVDLNSLPLPPQNKQQLEEAFDVISAADCDPSETGGDVLSRLHDQLTTQLKLCLATRDHNHAMGNVAEANRFERLADSVKQDRDVVILAKRTDGDIPKFHYEMRQFAIIQCNTDLNDNDLELTIVRGITYNVPNPKEVDTYVKFEYPYPQDAPVCDRTAVVKNTNSPEYDAVFPLAINRSSRACLRLFKRHAIKLEVWSRGGFFSRDSLLGTATVKLQPLETRTTIHDAFPLMEGRRAAGGALEVKVRLRHPLLGKQVDTSQHKWLVVDPAA